MVFAAATEWRETMEQLETIRTYWNTRADGYSRSVMEEIAEAGNDGSYWTTLIDAYLPQTDHPKILDLGCGPGFFTMLLGQRGCQMTAFDYSDEMLRQAELNAASVGVNAVFVQGDAQMLPFADESFDMIVTRNLTWNLQQPEKAYKEWLRVLKAGGCLLNYDGNYYLHYYDEEYRKEYEIRQMHHGDEHKYIGDVDVNIINQVARDLPLSRQKRPQWDMNLLLEMGARRLETEVDRATFQDENGKDHQVIDHFMIYAVK